VIFSGLIGAIIWDLITWYYGLPTSSSHALFGGYAGAAVAKAGFPAIIVAGWINTIIFIVLAPLIGLCVGLLVMNAIYFFFSKTPPSRVDRWFRRLQLVSAAAFSLMHGANDAQKTMGLIAGALVTGGFLQLQNGQLPIPFWVVLAAHLAIGLGTLSGGWRIIHTMGSKITKLHPEGGFAAETGAAVAIYTATHLGIGISTTHTITGAIVGVGATRRLSAVRWGVARQIVWAWVLTIPAAAAIGANLLPRRVDARRPLRLRASASCLFHRGRFVVTQFFLSSRPARQQNRPDQHQDLVDQWNRIGNDEVQQEQRPADAKHGS
jgi:PiT family inorganic phosphate transporter